MKSTHPQLLPIPLDLSDVVYTPDWVARDMVAVLTNLQRGQYHYHVIEWRELVQKPLL